MKKIAVSIWLFVGLFAFSLFSENSLGSDSSGGISIPEEGDLQHTPLNGPFFYSTKKPAGKRIHGDRTEKEILILVFSRGSFSKIIRFPKSR